MVVLDADSGRLIATLPIGKGTDAAAFDPARKLAFSSNRDGTLTVVKENSAGSFSVIGNVKTLPRRPHPGDRPGNRPDFYGDRDGRIGRGAKISGRRGRLQLRARHREGFDL